MSSKKNRNSQGLVSITPAERRRIPRAHRGFQVFVAPMLELCESYPQLRGPGFDEQATLAALRSYQALAAEQLAAEAELARVKDTRLQQSSMVWMRILDIYARAQVLARWDPVLKEAILDFERFMKQTPREKPSPAQSTP